MRNILLLILLLAISEIFLLEPSSKIELWQNAVKKEGSEGAKFSVAVTPQIMVLRNNFQDFEDKEGISTLPLGSQSHSSIIFCEESRGMIQYKSDRYGFRNYDSAWDAKVEIAMVGDSFAQGACIPDGEDIASHLRQSFGNVLNLGSLGNGPLGDLAVVSEYVRSLAPKKVLWFYVANDLFSDMAIEKQTPLLRAYKDPHFTQALAHRVDASDGVIQKFLQDEAR